MRKAIVFAVLAVCCSCTDPVEPIAPEPSKHVFAVTALQDSIYWEEPSYLVINEKLGDPARIKFFLGFTRIPVDRLAEDTIFYTLPAQTHSGYFRLYKDDSIQAAGIDYLYIYPIRIGVTPFVEKVEPLLGYVGDIVTFKGRSMPVRMRDVKAAIGNVEAHVLYTDYWRTVVRIPVGATTDTIRLLHRGEPVGPTLYQVTATSGDFLPSMMLKKATLVMLDIVGKQRWSNGLETTVDSGLGGSFVGISSQITKSSRTGDKLILEGGGIDRSTGVPDTNSFKLDLTVDRANHTVSGTITFTQERASPNSRSQSVRLVLNKMNWREDHLGYLHIYALANDVGSQLTSLEYHFENNGITLESVSYAGSNFASSFYLKLAPY